MKKVNQFSERLDSALGFHLNLDRLFEKVEDLHQTIDQVLTGEKNLDQPNFEICTDFKPLEDLPSLAPDDEEDKALFVLDNLAPYFRFGMMIQGNKKLSTQFFFFHGHKYQVPPTDIILKLPKSGPLKVSRVRSKKIKESLRLNFLSSADDSYCYCFSPCPDYTYIFELDIPEVWMKDHIQKIHSFIFRSFAI